MHCNTWKIMLSIKRTYRHDSTMLFLIMVNDGIYGPSERILDFFYPKETVNNNFIMFLTISIIIGTRLTFLDTF